MKTAVEASGEFKSTEGTRHYGPLQLGTHYPCSGSESTTPLSAVASKPRVKKVKRDDLATVALQCLEEIKQMENDNEQKQCRNVPDDPDAKYGDFIAAEMRKIDSEIEKQKAKADIQNIFLKAHLGQYSTPRLQKFKNYKNSVCFDVSIYNEK